MTSKISHSQAHIEAQFESLLASLVHLAEMGAISKRQFEKRKKELALFYMHFGEGGKTDTHAGGIFGIADIASLQKVEQAVLFLFAQQYHKELEASWSKNKWLLEKLHKVHAGSLGRLFAPFVLSKVRKILVNERIAFKKLQAYLKKCLTPARGLHIKEPSSTKVVANVKRARNLYLLIGQKKQTIESQKNDIRKLNQKIRKTYLRGKSENIHLQMNQGS